MVKMSNKRQNTISLVKEIHKTLGLKTSTVKDSFENIKRDVGGYDLVYLDFQPSDADYKKLKALGWTIEDIDRSDATVTKGKTEVRFVY